MYVKTLYDPGMIANDLRCQSLSPMALALFAVLQGLCNAAEGFLRLGVRDVTPGDIARMRGFGDDVSGFVAELVEMGLLAEGGGQWFMPDQRARAILRAKRQAAGSKGGRVARARPETVAAPVCSSNVVSFEKSKDCADAGKKEKRTKKEKNNNYIYIFRNKVFVGDAGTADNPLWFTYGCIRLCRRSFTALAETFGLAPDTLQDILEKQADWLETQEPSRRAYWFATTLKHLQNVTGFTGAAA